MPLKHSWKLINLQFKTSPRDTDNLLRFSFKSLHSTSNHKNKCCITRYFTVASSNLRVAVLFWHKATGQPSVDVMVQLAKLPPIGWPQELTPTVVRKYFPLTCASCPLGNNLQDTDRYDNFEPTVIGQEVELDLKTWTEPSGKRTSQLHLN